VPDLLPAAKDLLGVADRAGQRLSRVLAGQPGMTPLRTSQLGQRGDVQVGVAQPDRVANAKVHVVWEVADDRAAGVVAAGGAPSARLVAPPSRCGRDDVQARGGVASGVRAAQAGHRLVQGEDGPSGEGCQALQGGGAEQGVVGVGCRAGGVPMCFRSATRSRLLAAARRVR
jgi:hypothetical protein